jgi:CO/xanthine dehydrogenase FAD-binding subunit
MTTYRDLLAPDVAARMPALAQAARTVGSPQIRQWGTIGGNLGTASPAGDALPPLLVYDARVELTSTRGTRSVPLGDFLTGVKRNAREADELITAVTDLQTAGGQHFAKVGTRNAMVIAVCSLAMRLDREAAVARVAIGSAAPTARRLPDVEEWLQGELSEAGWRATEPLAAELGRRVAAAAAPIDDVRGSAAYRRHALGVLAGRCLTWCTGA